MDREAQAGQRVGTGFAAWRMTGGQLVTSSEKSLSRPISLKERIEFCAAFFRKQGRSLLSQQVLDLKPLTICQSPFSF
jgi:hypothetical protein